MATERSPGLTDAQWRDGWEELKANLPSSDLTPELAARRGNSYRRELGYLTNEQWVHAVGVAVRTLRWFPVIAELLEFAREVPLPVAGLLPAAPARRVETPADVEEWRRGINAGLEEVKRALAARGIDVERVGRPMPAAPAQRRRRA